MTGVEKMFVIHIYDKRLISREFPGGPVVRPLTAEGLGSILGQETKIPQAGSMDKKKNLLLRIYIKNFYKSVTKRQIMHLQLSKYISNRYIT